MWENASHLQGLHFGAREPRDEASKMYVTPSSTWIHKRHSPHPTPKHNIATEHTKWSVMTSTSSLAELLSSSVLEVTNEEAQTPKRPRLQSEEEHKEWERLVLKNKNENTARSTNTWVNRFENWRVVRGLPLPLLKIRHEDLDKPCSFSTRP